MRLTCPDTLDGKTPTSLSGLCLLTSEWILPWAHEVCGLPHQLRRMLNRPHWWENFDNCGPAAVAMSHHGVEWCRKHHFSSCRRLIAISSLTSNFVEHAAAALFDVDMNLAFGLFMSDVNLKRLIESQEARRSRDCGRKSWRWDHTWLNVVRVAQLLDVVASEVAPHDDQIRKIFVAASAATNK